MSKRDKRWDVHDRLLRLFDGNGYEVFDAGKYVFVKQWNGNVKRWQVAIYPRASWSASREWKEASKVPQQLDGQLSIQIDKD